jgi:hypothetical protein
VRVSAAQGDARAGEVVAEQKDIIGLIAGLSSATPDRGEART